jgi:hypothetical protein
LNLEKLLLISFSIILLFTIYSNSSYAELVGVKITSPTKGQQTLVGIKNLPISGVASYNPTMNCQVSLIVNDLKPYQKAAGLSKTNYSSWNYVLTPNYTSIKQGINKLTAKLSCQGNSMNITKFYSINITGVKSSSIQPSKSSFTKTFQTKNETTTSFQTKQDFTKASFALPVKQLSSGFNGILARTGTLFTTHGQAPSQFGTPKHHPHTTGKTATILDKAYIKKHILKNRSITPATAVNNAVAISTTSNGVGNVVIPPAINGPASNVTIPKQAASGLGLNNTVGQEQQSNTNTPFVFARPLSPSPYFAFNNNHQSSQIPPIANPGPSQVVAPGSTVILNGSGSKSPGGIILSYSWRQIPTSAVIGLTGVSTPVWEFTAPNVPSDTLLRFQLNVTDNLGQTGTAYVNILDKPGFTFNAPTRTQIMKSPYVPEIIKSPYGRTETIPLVNLNKGSTSVIPTNRATIPPPLIPPVNSPPLIPPVNSPPLIPPVNSRFSAQAYGGALPAFPNYPPTANAGPDQVVNANSTVTLVGSLSKDPNGYPLSYYWTQISGNDASTLGGANTPVWEFTAPNVASDTKLTFQLTVTNSHGLSNSGRVTVLVRAPVR